MIKKEILESKNLGLYLTGKEFLLNNGATVVLPSLPIGMQAYRFIRMKDAISQPEMIPLVENGAKVLEPTHSKDRNNELRYDVDGNPVMIQTVKMIPNPEYIDLQTESGMTCIAKLLWEIIKLNFDITIEQSDGLFSMSHFNKVFTWFYTGRDDLNIELEMKNSNGSGSDRPTERVSEAALMGDGKDGGQTRSNEAKKQELVR